MVQFKNIQKKVLPCDEIWAFVVIWATESEIGDVLVAIFTAKKLHWSSTGTKHFSTDWPDKCDSTQLNSRVTRIGIFWLELKDIMNIWFFSTILLIMMLKINIQNVIMVLYSSWLDDI